MKTDCVVVVAILDVSQHASWDVSSMFNGHEHWRTLDNVAVERLRIRRLGQLKFIALCIFQVSKIVRRQCARVQVKNWWKYVWTSITIVYGLWRSNFAIHELKFIREKCFNRSLCDSIFNSAGPNLSSLFLCCHDSSNMIIIKVCSWSGTTEKKSRPLGLKTWKSFRLKTNRNFLFERRIYFSSSFIVYQLFCSIHRRKLWEYANERTREIENIEFEAQIWIIFEIHRTWPNALQSTRQRTSGAKRRNNALLWRIRSLCLNFWLGKFTKEKLRSEELLLHRRCILRRLRTSLIQSRES